MVQYLAAKELEKYLKAMTILDIVMQAKDDAWLRRICFYELENAHSYVLDNGSGDNLVVMFSKNCVLMKGFDHENELNQFAADEWDNAFFERIYAELPEELASLLNEDDKDNTTFCMWCVDDTDIWTQNETKGNDGGKEYLLMYICKTPEEWSDWAEDYYETEIAPEVVQKVYNGENLTEEDVKKLNPGRDPQEVFSEIEEYF